MINMNEEMIKSILGAAILSNIEKEEIEDIEQKEDHAEFLGFVQNMRDNMNAKIEKDEDGSVSDKAAFADFLSVIKEAINDSIMEDMKEEDEEFYSFAEMMETLEENKEAKFINVISGKEYFINKETNTLCVKLGDNAIVPVEVNATLMKAQFNLIEEPKEAIVKKVIPCTAGEALDAINKGATVHFLLSDSNDNRSIDGTFELEDRGLKLKTKAPIRTGCAEDLFIHALFRGHWAIEE